MHLTTQYLTPPPATANSANTPPKTWEECGYVWLEGRGGRSSVRVSEGVGGGGDGGGGGGECVGARGV